MHDSSRCVGESFRTRSHDNRSPTGFTRSRPTNGEGNSRPLRGIINLVKAVPKAELYRRLPSVDELLHAEELAECVFREGQASVADAARVVLARLREEITAGALQENQVDLAVSGLAGAIAAQLRNDVSFSLKAVINASGVILHTNLGRAPLSRPALEHVQATSAALLQS